MKTWLKGGLIGVGFMIFIFIVSFILSALFVRFGFYLYYYLISLPVGKLFGWLASPGSSPFWGEFGQPTLLAMLINLILYFIIGSIIGLIIQKIKSK